MRIYRLSIFESSESGSLEEVLHYLSDHDTYSYDNREFVCYTDTLEAGLQELRKYKTSISVCKTNIVGKYGGDMKFAALEWGDYYPDDYESEEEALDYVEWELCETTPMPDHVSVPGEPYHRVWLNNEWFEPEYPDGIKAVIQGTSGRYYWFDDPDWDFDLERERCVYVFEADKAAGCHFYTISRVAGDVMPEDYVDEPQNELEAYWAEYARSGDWGDHYVVLYYHWDGKELLQLADVDIRPWQIVQNIRANRYVEGAEYYRI